MVYKSKAKEYTKQLSQKIFSQPRTSNDYFQRIKIQIPLRIGHYTSIPDIVWNSRAITARSKSQYKKPEQTTNQKTTKIQIVKGTTSQDSKNKATAPHHANCGMEII